MPIQRVFLGHDRPAVRAAAEYLFRRYSSEGTADLQRAMVFVPGSLAGRRLLEVLVEEAAQRSLILTPPTIETVGRMPEHLYRPKRPFATDLTQRLVWAEALRQSPPDQLTSVMVAPPALADSAHWVALGDLLRRQHIELAADGLSFADVAKLGQFMEGFPEQSRWQALNHLQQEYLRRLDALELWDLQTARLKAVEFGECQTDSDILLFGTVDLNVTMRKMLDQVASRVTSLIVAPENWQSRFDEHGCLIPSAWENLDLQIVSDQVEVVDSPADQAKAVARYLRSLAGRYCADEIVIGVPDEEVVPDVERQLAIAGLTARWGPGQPFDRTAPVRLLMAIAEYLDEPQYAEFATLVRHPDVERWLTGSNLPADWLEKLDEYQTEHLPYRMSADTTAADGGTMRLRQVGEAMQRLLGDLTQPARLLMDWSEPVWRVLMEVYGERPLHVSSPADSAIFATCQGIRSVLLEWARIPSEVAPKVASHRAIRYLLDELQKSFVPAASTPEAVEMLGWLELPLDDAPALVVTSFNEGFVPESLNSDLFLPDGLRRRLGLLDNSRRYARDAYAVSVLTATRESLHWIVGRRNHEGDPIAPSRLLFACDSETTAQRALQVFRPVGTTPSTLQRPSAGQTMGIEVPHPRPLAKPIERLNVTAFRDYLACPYRFYLKHVLRLEVISDASDELDGAAFGSLAHEVLRRFGTSPNRDTSDANLIRETLDAELDQCAASMFGTDPLPAVLVQIEQLRWRLRAFADHQAAWYEQGWRIEHIESPSLWEDASRFEVDGKPMCLCGRLDRIDVHSTTGERVILDYKTSDTGSDPDAVHRHQGEWIDLQLPLYRHLVSTLGIAGPVRMGYILLPKDVTVTGFAIAEWSLDELNEADELAREVIRQIRREEFWPPTDPPPDFSEDFAAICQDGVVRS